MFWDCFTCDFACWFAERGSTHHKTLMAWHEIYHHLWLGCEIDMLTGEVIEER